MKIELIIPRCTIGEKTYWDQQKAKVQFSSFFLHASVQYVQSGSVAEQELSALLDLSTAKHLFGSADCLGAEPLAIIPRHGVLNDSGCGSSEV